MQDAGRTIELKAESGSGSAHEAYGEAKVCSGHPADLPLLSKLNLVVHGMSALCC